MLPLMRRMEEAWRAIAAHRSLVVLAVAALSLGSSLVVSAIRVPEPRLHDEFSYLLAADTFSHGRLANPPHALWPHFETFHVLQQPAYASKYPPAQGLFLALGKALGGHPIVGVWLATALAAAACCWMFQAFVPPRFVLLGGVLVAFHHGLQFYWQNYWNGSVAMLGGALLYGALPRLWRRPSVGPALALAVGIALLANSRPYSGLIAALPVVVALGWRMMGPQRPPFSLCFRRILLPVSVVLIGVGFWMGHYNERVTGSPLRLPYQVHSEQYAYTPVFLWQAPRPLPSYRNSMFERFYVGWQEEGYREQRSLSESFRHKRKNLYFFVTPLLMVPLLTLPWMLRSRRSRFALLCVALVFGASLGVAGTHAHYIAPVAPLLFLLVVQGLRRLDPWRWLERPVGHWLVVAIAVVQVGIFAAACVLYGAQEPPAWATRRASIQEELEAMPGKHLVLARYADDQSPHEEWVWNEASIDAAKVIWARPLAPDAERRLIDAFSDRQVWNLFPHRTGGELQKW